MLYTGFYYAFRTDRDVALGRDFVLLGQQMGGPHPTADACRAYAERTWGNLAETLLIVPGEALKGWRPSRERLDEFLSRRELW